MEISGCESGPLCSPASTSSYSSEDSRSRLPTTNRSPAWSARRSRQGLPTHGSGATTKFREWLGCIRVVQALETHGIHNSQ